MSPTTHNDEGRSDYPSGLRICIYTPNLINEEEWYAQLLDLF